MNVQKASGLKTGDLVWCVLPVDRRSIVRQWLPQLSLEHYIVRRCRVDQHVAFGLAVWVNKLQDPHRAHARLVGVSHIFTDKDSALKSAKRQNDQVVRRLFRNLREMNKSLNSLSDEVFRHIGKIS